MRVVPARLWALAVLSGFLQVLVFPLAGPAPVWRTALCWIALVPLLKALLGNDRYQHPIDSLQGAFLGYVCGFAFFLGNCSWIFQTMHLYGGLPQPVAAGVLILFCLYLGLYQALFGALLARVRQRFGPHCALWFVPFLWVAVELARARITSFPWDPLGIAQVDNPLLVRLAPLAGAYALSFVIAAVNALWLARIRLRPRPYLRPLLTLAGCLIVLLYLLALRRLPPPQSAPMTATATLLQENLQVGAAANTGSQETRDELLASFTHFSRNPAQAELNGIPGLPATRLLPVPDFPYVADPGYQPTDLIVWPESPSGLRTDDPAFTTAAAALARTTHAPLILGSLGVVPNTDPAAARRIQVFDSAALFTPTGTAAGRYDKIHLVPFGEYVPFKQLLFFADRLTAGVGDMDRGTARTVFRTSDTAGGGTHAFGIFVCYESIFADEVRHFVLNGAEVLVNISDDGWYGDSGAPWQHLNMVRMRAIENHRWILRATNTGITSAISPQGRVTAALPRHLRAALNVPFAFEQDTTFYTRHGDWFAYLCALVTLAALLPYPGSRSLRMRSAKH